MPLSALPPVLSRGRAWLFLALAIAAVGLGKWLGWDSAVQNLILVFALFVALVSLWMSRNTERQKATLDFLRAYNASDVVHEGTRILNKWRTGEEHSTLDDRQLLIVNEFLNLFELLAIGLKSGIYDEQMKRGAMETLIVRYYRKAEPFIKAARNKDNDVRDVAFEHFENLAARIQKELKGKGRK